MSRYLFSLLFSVLWLWGGQASAETLRLVSQPRRAKVYVDGVFRGSTPLLLRMEKGRYHLELRRRSYLTWATYIELPARTKMKLEINLEKMSDRSRQARRDTYSGSSGGATTGSGGSSVSGKASQSGLLLANSKPSGASVYLGGRLLGSTPLLLHLPKGSHRLTFQLSGHSPIIRQIKMSRTKTTRVSVKFPTAGGKVAKSKERTKVGESTSDSGSTLLMIYSKPSAKVYLNGRIVGETPVLSAGISPGRYQLMLKRKGYFPYRRDFLLGRGQQLRFRILLVQRSKK